MIKINSDNPITQQKIDKVMPYLHTTWKYAKIFWFYTKKYGKPILKVSWSLVKWIGLFLIFAIAGIFGGATSVPMDRLIKGSDDYKRERARRGRWI